LEHKVETRIKEFRKENGLTQEELASAVGVSRQTIISIEKGKYIPSLPLALRIAEYFASSTDDIFRIKE
jgi:putative transcriptional regulator